MRYDEVIERLLAANPDFAQSNYDVYESLPMDVAGTFANYVVDLLEQGTSSEDARVWRAFSFINELVSSGDERVQNLLVTGILEVLADPAAVREVARRLLVPAASDLFEKVIRGWWGDEGPNQGGPA